MEEILVLPTIDYYIEALGHRTEAGRAYREEIFATFQRIHARAKALGSASVDSSARILPEKGDATSLGANLGILKSKLDGKAAEPVAVFVTSDFDPTLVSAHQLLDKLTQALAINRF